MQEPSGLIASPELVNSVTTPAEGEHCEWRITATHGERIVLNVTRLDIYESDNCETDYVEVRDGYWHKSPLLGERSSLCSSPVFPCRDRGAQSNVAPCDAANGATLLLALHIAPL
ncbi:hypothetical protein V5799_002238 [Amblyomma americanum]|uniref:CUB domain-containing protein n=1 Tax=Amblyomma americanum TaxID=6943 RepID=A0AAQ4CXX0_AMBAM